MTQNSASATRESMIEDLGLTGLESGAQDEILAAVGENVLKAVTLAALLKLPPDAQEEFKRLSEANDTEGLSKLLKTHITDPDAFVAAEAKKEIAAFKETRAQKLAA